MNSRTELNEQREDIEHHLLYLISGGAKAIASDKEDDWKAGEELLERASKLIAPLSYLDKMISRQAV